MTLTKANTGDIPLIQEIAGKAFRDAYAEILSETQISYMLELMYSETSLQEDFRNENYQYFLISPNTDETAGFLGLEHHYEPETTKLHRIYLLAGQKGKGFGKSALDFAKKITAQSCDRRIILNVNKENPAIKFYESQHFRTFSEGVFDIGNGYVMDDFLMEYLL